MPKLTLCVDFDGVVHSYTSGWHGVNIVADPPVRGAFEWLLKATKFFDINIYSSRSNQPGGIAAMYAWFVKWAPIVFAGDKESADKLFLTIDDRCVQFNGDWSDPTLDPAKLMQFKPWNKK